MSRILIIAPDSLGDQILRHRLYSEIQKAGHELAIIHRPVSLEILSILAPKAHLIDAGIDIYNTSEAKENEPIQHLLQKISQWNPDLLLAPLKNPTWLECTIFEHFQLITRLSVHVATSPDSPILDNRARLASASSQQITTLEDHHDIMVISQLLECIGINPNEHTTWPSLAPQDIPEIQNLLVERNLSYGEYAVCNPAGFTNIPIKIWPKQSAIETILHLKNAHQTEVLLIGVESETDYITAIAQETGAPYWIGEKGSLPTCIALMRAARFYIGTDTGTMHLAGALGLPVLGIFGGGLWPRFLPMARRRAIVTHRLPCFGCDWICHYSEPYCITNIKTEAIKSAIHWLIRDFNEPGEHMDTGMPQSECDSAAFTELVHNYKAIRRKYNAMLNQPPISNQSTTEEPACASPQQQHGNDPQHNLKQKIQMTSANHIIAIVTPTLNSEKYLEETILSVVTQRGDFAIRYHIQDGLSTDSTVEILKKWTTLLSEGTGFMGCAPVIFTWSSERDTSMYDSIDKGFRHALESLPQNKPVLMTWINSDDKLASGSMETALSAHRETGFNVITGLSSIITHTGAVACTMSYKPLSRENIQKGLHDGRSLWFIMQEGTYWSRDIWEKSGGLNTTLKLAGDWDLWRKLATHADWLGIHTALAHHRRHATQLSNNMTKYWAEVDKILTAEGLIPIIPTEETYGNEAYIDINTNQWVVNKKNVSPHIAQNKLPTSGDWTIDFSSEQLPPQVQCTIGLSDIESWGRWSDARLHDQAIIKLINPLPKNFILHLKAGAYCGANKTTFITVKIGENSHRINADHTHEQHRLQFTNTLGCNVIALYTDNPTVPADINAGSDQRKLGVALVAMGIETIAPNTEISQ